MDPIKPKTESVKHPRAPTFLANALSKILWRNRTKASRMVLPSVLTGGSPLNPPSPTPISRTRRGLKHPIAAPVIVPCACGVIKQQTLNVLVSQFLRVSNSKLRSKKSKDADNYETAKNIVDGQEREPTDMGISFLLILAIAVGIAGVITITSVNLNQPSAGSFFGVLCLAEGSASSVMDTPPVGFSFKAFGYRIILPEYAPGWIYFWLLMAAGCGLFISEEALNVWVGINLSRMLTLDGTWQSLVASFSRNASYILSTVLWVYCGVCISDMIPFYLGRLFRQSGTSGDVCAKLGIGEEKVLSITRAVHKYGNLSGFVERLSLGVRNPTAFLAGTLGISPECFFAGVCCGGLITLPLQLGIGFLLRERPVFALATVATVVGIWTVFPYITAALTALLLYLRSRYST